MMTLFGLLVVAATATATAESTKTVLAFGDSWAWLGYAQFKEVFGAHNVTTAMHAIPGTPAGYWAVVQPHALVRAVDAANADAVYLSIGGNDFLEGLPAGHLVGAIHAEMIMATQSMVNTLLALRPNVHVFHFGYELLNWGSDPLCKAMGALELFGPKPLCLDVANVTCMTRAQAMWLQTKFIDEGLARTYASNPKYHPLNLLGTLQAAGGVPGARVGAPNFDHFTPAKYVRGGLDSFGCVHLTEEGYTTLYSEMFKHVIPHLETPRGGEVRGGEVVVEDKAWDKELEPRVGEKTTRRPCLSDAKRQCSVVNIRAVSSFD